MSTEEPTQRGRLSASGLALPLLALIAGCATAPPLGGWVRPGGLEERARLTLDVSLTLKHGDRVVQVVKMPQATGRLQGRVAPGATPEVQLAVVDVQVELPDLPLADWTTFPPLATGGRPKVPGEQIDERDALLAYQRWTSALLVPGLVAIGTLPPPPGEGSCAQVVLSELGRDTGPPGEDLFELELALALLSGTMSPPASASPSAAAAAAAGGDDDPEPGRCRWRVTGQQGEVATVTTLAARMRSPYPGRVKTHGVLKTLTTTSYLGSKSTVEADTTLIPGKLLPKDGRLTVRSRYALPRKLTGAKRASYVYEITLRIVAD